MKTVKIFKRETDGRFIRNLIMNTPFDCYRQLPGAISVVMRGFTLGFGGIFFGYN